MIDFSTLSYLDYFVLIVIVLSTFFAFIRGFIGSFISAISWAATIYLTYTLSPLIKPFLEQKITNPIIAVAACYILLFVGLVISFGILNIFIVTLIRGFSAGLLDRTLGAGFGVIRGTVVVCFIYLITLFSLSIFNGAEDFSQMDENELPKWLRDSQTYPFLKEGSSIILNYIPSSFYQTTQKFYDDTSKKSSEDRFIETTLKKIQKNLSDKKIEEINQIIDKEHADKTSNELKYHKLNEYLNAYLLVINKNNKATLSKHDLERFKSIKNRIKEDIKSSDSAINH